MQSKENSTTDARTFPQIWETLNRAERRTLKVELVKAMSCTTNAVWFWSNGTYSPNSKLDRDKVAQVVSKFLGRKCFAHTLFPNK